MVTRTQPDELAALERLARLRADRELARFSDFRQHMKGLEGEITRLQANVLAGYPAEGDFSIAEARRSHAMTRADVLDLRRTEGELMAHRPPFEAARQRAIREFGRAEALGRLQVQARTLQRARRDAAAQALAMGPGS